MANVDSIRQTVLDDPSIPQRVTLHHISSSQLASVPQQFSSDADKRGGASFIPIGVSYTISPTGYLATLALADTHSVFLVDVRHRQHLLTSELADIFALGGSPAYDGREWCLTGFSFSRCAIQLQQATGTRVRGVDLSTLLNGNTWKPDYPGTIVQKRISKSVNTWNINSLWLGSNGHVETNHRVALQAWLAASVASRSSAELFVAAKIDTSFLNSDELRCVSQLVAQTDLAESHAPKEILNEFTSAAFNKDGKLAVNNMRYKTRIKRSELSQVVMTDRDGVEHIGSASGTSGRQTRISVHTNRNLQKIDNIKVVGRSEPTNPERSRDELIRLLLSGRKSMRTSAFIRTLWFPESSHSNNCIVPTAIEADIACALTADMKLNPSQCGSVAAIVGQKPMVVIHGPPGTGKTTTIAAASKIWSMYSRPVWIVAHSNVAVKNIAETLFKKAVDFRLLVSKDFYDEWHEHLYTEVVAKLIRSDELPSSSKEMRSVLGGAQIMLCTLSMISNPALLQNGTFQALPVERLIVDEASQINLFEFMHVFERFHKSLQKVIYVGDPKQLPPYGQDNIKTIKTIFDMQRVLGHDSCLFLDTQYRLPMRIGEFISNAIYDGRLKSHHPIDGHRCVSFVDVSPPRGSEGKQGVSWKNQGEIDTIVNLVKFYYRLKNFCIITPYDAQRAAIQSSLEAAGLPSDSVFNVDSFQGNEADYVLVSVVRSSTQPGFLTSENRMNVLLTRCRKGMVIVSSRKFMADLGGARTVLGAMHRHWMGASNSAGWIDWRQISSGTADLPGAPGPNRACPVQTPNKKPTTTPTTHRGYSSSFNASSSFKPKFPAQDGWRPESTTHFNHIHTARPTFHRPPNVASSVEFPPLTATKMPILPGTWADLRVGGGGVKKDAPSKYSLLPKKPDLRDQQTKRDEKPMLQRVIAVTNPTGPSKRPHTRGQQAPFAVSLVSTSAPSAMSRTNIYRRRR